jgi:hypothetical protein
MAKQNKNRIENLAGCAENLAGKALKNSRK